MLNETILDSLKFVDADRYRAALFADSDTRNKLLTLYAFHAELAKVPELVSEPMIGAIRYQWWRDVIEEIYSGGRVRSHEVTHPLAAVLREADIPRFWVDKLIDGRERDLDPTPFTDLDAAKLYSRNTSGVLLQIAVHLTGEPADDAALLDLGEAWGLTGLARGWRFYTNGMLSNLEFTYVCQSAYESHKFAKSSLGKLSENLVPAIAYAGLIPKYLARMKRRGFDPKSDAIHYSAFLKQVRLMGVALTGRV